jgi:hypothetical protein
MNYTSFFQACNIYAESCAEFTLIEHEYFLFHLLCHIDHDEVSVRRVLGHCSKAFLQHCTSLLEHLASE